MKLQLSEFRETVSDFREKITGDQNLKFTQNWRFSATKFYIFRHKLSDQKILDSQKFRVGNYPPPMPRHHWPIQWILHRQQQLWYSTITTYTFTTHYK